VIEVVSAEDLRRRLSMTAAIDALEVAFRTGDPSSTPARTRVETPGGTMLLMPATDATAGVGVKLVTISPGNPVRGFPFVNAVYALFDADTQSPEAVIDGAALTAIRTAAVSGLATRWLANDGAGDLVIFGAGVQAGSHLEAMLAVRPIRRVTIVSRGRARAEGLAGEARTRDIEASVGEPDVVSGADIICTCTTAGAPLFDGRLLSPGSHVNAVGAYTPVTRELDTATVERGRVVVETREAAFEEAGDLLVPIDEGAIDRGHVVADLKQLVSGRTVRSTPADITVFKSVGLAFEDLVVARAALGAS
jgi:ornithine cyclodeaminase